MHDSMITCDEIKDAGGKSYNDETRIIPTNFNEKKVTCKTQNLFYLRLNQVDVLEDAILVMTYLIQYVFQIKKKI